MNPFKFATAICLLLGSVTSSVISLISSQSDQVALGSAADTPLFYLVSSSKGAFSNLLPLRINGNSGGFSTLSGPGFIGEFFFIDGKFVALSPGTNVTLRGFIGAVPTSSGCTTYGPLGFSISNSNKCALFNTFELESNNQDSQLGAKLVFNFVGNFYACGPSNEVWYKIHPQDGPPTPCTPIDLYTVPVPV